MRQSRERQEKGKIKSRESQANVERNPPDVTQWRNDAVTGRPLHSTTAAGLRPPRPRHPLQPGETATSTPPDVTQWRNDVITGRPLHSTTAAGLRTPRPRHPPQPGETATSTPPGVTQWRNDAITGRPLHSTTAAGLRPPRPRHPLQPGETATSTHTVALSCIRAEERRREKGSEEKRSE